MNREETHALWRQGKDAWNAWAAERLAEKKRLEEAGEWEVEKDFLGRLEPKNEATTKWMAAAAADFSSEEQPFTFEEPVYFSGWTFPGDAGFREARFTGDAGFEGAKFSGTAGFGKATFLMRAWFEGAMFSGTAWFPEAQFLGLVGFERASFASFASFEQTTFSWDAWFTGATFSWRAWFERATFLGDAWLVEATFKNLARFVRVRFEGLTRFEDTLFEGLADFTAARVESAFSLAGATFHTVPDFTQVHCAEAPRLDNAEVHRGLVEPGSFLGSIVKAPHADVTSRYRSLKRLAIQAHDHEKEQEFFAGELRTRRNAVDKVWHVRWWFGVVYELLSDFGRSMWRPIAAWVVVTLLFAWFYLGAHLSAPRGADEPPAPVASASDWALNGVYLWTKEVGISPRWIKHPAVDGAKPMAPLVCLSGGDGEAGGTTPEWAALGLSLRKGLLFAGLGDTDRASQDYACLYGLDRELMKLTNNSQLVRRVPNRVAYWGLAQTFVSIVLIFLFLLAVRNHFKLK